MRRNRNVVGNIEPYDAPYLKCTKVHIHDEIEVKEQKHRPFKFFDPESTVIHLESGQRFTYRGPLSGLCDTTAVVKLGDDRVFLINDDCLEQVIGESQDGNKFGRIS